MGGSISVESRPGEGSCFRFSIGVEATGEPECERTPIALPVGAGPEHASARASRVLLAEDNPVNQSLAIRILEKHGHRVTLAANGREAIEAWSKERFDIILMDVQMPQMTGFEATEEIRRIEQGSGRHIPIVAMTAHAMKGDCERCLACGMDSYISKPIRARDLLEMLEKLSAAA